MGQSHSINSPDWMLATVTTEGCVVRTAVSFLLVAGLAASLAACSSPTTVAGCTPAASGSSSDSVTVTGELGAEPTVEFPAPLTVDATQRTVAIEGEGDTVANLNDQVTIDFTLYNATTGTKLTATPYTEEERADFSINESVYLVGLIKTLQCSQVGSRVVGVIPASDGFGDTGSTDLGVAAGDALVFIADVVSISPGAADGKPVDVTDDTLPTVKLAEDGTPTITIPDADPPAEFKLAVLKQGDGTVVAEGDSVTVQYVGINWNTKTVFDQSWNKSGPVTFATTGVVPGFSQGMVGQKVGSQILVVIPPELGYGPSGGSGDSISATDTIVFVIDILATEAPAAE